METKMKLSDVKRELSNLPQKELITIISDLYKKNKDVQHTISLLNLVGKRLRKNYFYRHWRRWNINSSQKEDMVH